MRTISIIFLAFLLNACSQSHLLKGDAAYDNLSFKKAAFHYEKALTGKDKALIHAKAAAAYLRMNETLKAEEHYKLAVSAGEVHPDTKLKYAKTLMANGKAAESREWMQAYLKENPHSLHGEEGTSNPETETEFVNYAKSPIVIDLVPLEGFSNVFSAYPSRKGIYFVGEKEATTKDKTNPWNGNSFLDIYQVTKIARNEWMQPEKATGDLNNALHDGPLSLDVINRVAYTTRSALNEAHRKKLDQKKTNQLKIVKFEMDNAGDWKEQAELSINQANSSSMHPVICSDNKTLFFASDREGGFGGNDLYMSRFDGQNWSEPVNLGPEINTKSNESFPFAFEKDTLFFASDGHAGLGGLDIFVSVYDGERWSAPQNLKAPINTRFDDFSLTRCEHGLGGYLSSNRNGKDEIFNWYINDPSSSQASNSPICTISKVRSRPRTGTEDSNMAFQVHGKVINQETKAPIANLPIALKDNSNTTVAETKSDKNGDFSFNLEADQHYLVNATKEKAYIHGVSISTVDLEDGKTFELVLELEKIAFEKPYILNNIYYDYNKYDIRSDVVGDLENLLNFLKANPNVVIELSAHTDSRGTSRDNLILSTKRAKSAVNYLMAHGIEKSRMTYKGYGETKLVNNCADGVDCSEEKHQENRRLEFKILKLN